MMISGWDSRYREILNEFNHNKKKDTESALLLDSILGDKNYIKKIHELIENQNVFVIGAGPSLSYAIPVLKHFKKTVTIVADSAIKPVIDNGIKPDIIVTDLDGDEETLRRIGKSKIIFVVHAHGDNISKLNWISNFKNCVGTTQTKPFGKIQNFGGFTDGDRAVFLASYFNAKKNYFVWDGFWKKNRKIFKYKTIREENKIKKIKKRKIFVRVACTKNQI